MYDAGSMNLRSLKILSRFFEAKRKFFPWSRAAATLSASQVSRIIHQLEDALGNAFFTVIPGQ